jgi:O-antigen biosynthesis protein
MNMGSKSHKVLIAGYFGFGNTGDETILEAMIQDLRILEPDISISVVSGNPQETTNLHHVKSVAWAVMREIIAEMKTCDLVILGGGGIFHDYWGFDTSTILTSKHIGISFYTSIALLTSILNIRLMLYSVGVGPLLTENGKFYVRVISELASVITVRDDESKNQLEDLNISAERIIVTADPVFRLQLSQPDASKTNNYTSGEFQIGIALRNWDVGIIPELWEANVALALDQFLDNYPKATAIFVPFQDSQEQLLDDLEISTRIQNLLRHSNRTKVLNETSTYFDRAINLSQCDIVLGMRLHSLIMAINCGKPVVGLIYDPKVKNLMSQVGIDKYAINLYEATDSMITSVIDEVIHNRTMISTQLMEKSTLLAESAFENARIVIDLLKNNVYQKPILSSAAESIFNSAILSLVNSVESGEKVNREVTEEVAQKEREIASLRFQLKELDAQVSKHEENLANLIGEIDTLHDEKMQLVNENTDHQIHINNLTQEYEKLKVIYDEQIQKYDQWIGEQKKLEIELNKSKQKTARLNKTISKLQEKYNRFTDQLISVQNIEKSEYLQKAEILEQQSSEKERQITFLNNELEDIKKSRGWKLLWRLWQIRLFLIPHGSSREIVLGRLYRNTHSIITSPVYYGKIMISKLLNWTGLRISNQAFTFKIYKDLRNRLFPYRINRLDVPYQSNLVSIVLPVYNGSAYLRESMDSILNQTYSRFEVIIVDDGSTDNSGQIAEEYAAKDNRVNVIHQKNQRLPGALNNGFRLAQGEFFTWTSHDNNMKPFFLEKMVECLSRHPSWDMVYANMDLIGEDGNPLYNAEWYSGYQVPFGSDHIHLPTNTMELNTIPNNFIGGAFLYRKQVNNLLAGYSSTQFTREDYDYWMQINSLMELQHTDFNYPVYDYRFHSHSLTSQDEILRITRDRKYLMVFDDFRRDYFLMPMIYVIDSNSENQDTIRTRNLLIEFLVRQGNVILTKEEYLSMSLPELWMPAIYLFVTTNSLETISVRIRSKTITKVMIYVSSQELPATVKPGWDICLAYEFDRQLPKIDGDCQGWWYSKDITTLINSVDIYVRSHHLKKIEQAIAQYPASDVKISVIICTYKRNEILEKALHSIANQTLLQKDYEVIVVDNNPGESGLAQLIDRIRKEEFNTHPESLKFVQCPALGLSYARNTGLAEAKSGILLFLDDDAIAKNDILERYCQVFSEHPEVGVVGGHIILNRPENLAIPWKEGWEKYWSQFVTGFNNFTTVNNWWEFPWGANWCANRKALMQIGGFRGRYGRRGNDFNGGEEIIAASLIHQLGYSIAILPEAVVIHFVEESRYTIKHLKNTIKSSLFVQYLAQQNLHLPVESNIRGSIHQVNETLRKCVYLILHPKDPRNKANLLEVSFQLSARIDLLFRQFVDAFRRVHF